MNEFEKRVIADFIEQNWQQFCDYCDEYHALDKQEAEDIFDHLEN